MGLRGIERVTKIHHTTVINWIKDAGIKLPDAPEEEILEITEIDELQTPTLLELNSRRKAGCIPHFH